MAAWTIQKANASDEGRLNELYNLMLDDLYGPSDDGGTEVMNMTGVWEDSECAVLTAVADGRIIGALHTEVHRPDDLDPYLFLGNFCVETAYRGQGIGTALLLQAEEQAKRMGVGHLVLDAGSMAYRAVRLYRRMGYVLRFPEEDGGWMIRHLPEA